MGGLGCDNMTCVLVCFLHEKPYQELVERCAKITRAKEAALKPGVAPHRPGTTVLSAHKDLVRWRVEKRAALTRRGKARKTNSK